MGPWTNFNGPAMRPFESLFLHIHPKSYMSMEGSQNRPTPRPHRPQGLLNIWEIVHEKAMGSPEATPPPPAPLKSPLKMCGPQKGKKVYFPGPAPSP